MMGRIGMIKHDIYTADKLDKILQVMAHAARIGEKRDYEVLLDGMKVVPRTSDIERFNEFSEYVSPDSECLTLYVYYGASKHCDSYFFYFKGIPNNSGSGLSGIGDLEEFKKVEREKILKEIRHEKLEAENEELKSHLEGYKEKETEWKKAKDGQLNSYGEIGSAILTSFLNGLMGKKGFPDLNDLAGVNKSSRGNGHFQKQTSEQNDTSQEGIATFKRIVPEEEEKEEVMEKKEETEASKTGPTEGKQAKQPGLDEIDQAFLAFAKIFKQKCKPEHVPLFVSIVKNLVLHPAALKSTDKQIRNFLNSKPKPGNQA
jgi:hypothetical protein